MNTRISARPTASLQHAINRNFSGGLVTENSNLALAQQFLTTADNVYLDQLGTPHARFGVNLFGDITGVASGNIVSSYYYAGAVINVHASGQISATNSSGIATAIWNTTIAAALPGAPAAWGTTAAANFAQQAGALIICNGVDKPLFCNELLQVRYLDDPATGSNVNTPRALLVASHKDFLILANTPTDKSTLYIGAQGTLYTAPGDPAPNNAVEFDISSFVSQGDPDIVAITQFKNKLVVFCYEVIIVMTLGIFEGGVHRPIVDDVLENYGAVAQRAIVQARDALYVLDRAGIMQYRRATLTDDLTPTVFSENIQSEVIRSMSGYSLTELSRGCFVVLDKYNHHIMWFTPNSSAPFVLHYNMPGNRATWTRFRDMNYTDATRSIEGRIFFSRGQQQFLYGNDPANEIHFDSTTSFDQPWDDTTLWDDGTGWIEPSLAVPQPINFRIVHPWSELRQPGRSKLSKYMNILTQCDGAGSTPLTVRMETDRLGTALSIDLNHTATPTMSNNPTNNEQWYAWPAKFVRMRFEISGSTQVRFKLVGIQLWYQTGAWGR